MRDNYLSYRRIDRSQFPALLQGLEPEIRAHEADLVHACSPGVMLAVWTEGDVGQRAFLPDLLIGEAPLLRDTLAWASAFLRGVGPLSGLIRITTPEEYAAHLRATSDGVRLGIEQIGVMTSLIIGEALARQGRQASEARVGPASAANTLSFALLRALIAAPYLDFEGIVHRWSAAQGYASDQRNAHISSAVTDFCRVLVSDLPIPGWRDRSSYINSLALQPSLLNETDQLRRQLNRVAPTLLPDSFWNDTDRLSAEAFVELVDSVSPTLLAMPGMESTEKAQILAKLASRANPEIGNQLELLRSSLDRLPEIGLWLGRLMTDQAPAKILSFNNGAGWRIARRLVSPVDLSSSPTADISWFELSLLGGAERLGAGQREFGSVELYPGCVIERTSTRPGQKADADMLEKSYARRARGAEEEDILSRAAFSLEDALAQIQRLRREQRSRR